MTSRLFQPRQMLKEELEAVRDNARALPEQRTEAKQELERRARIRWNQDCEKLNRKELKR